jgi:CelD/BcsL family acetyltransferase involved in cellulose biosynthesis
MTYAATLQTHPASAAPAPDAKIFAHVEAFASFEAAESVWRHLEASGGMATPYQGYDLVDAWQTHVGSRNGATPLAVVFHDEDDRPAVLLPLVTQSFGPFRIARFPGDKHSNMNMPLWRRDFAERATQAMMREILRLLKLKAPQLDALIFDRQPLDWNGVRNPLALLPHQDSVDQCPMLTIDPSQPPASWISKSFRRRLNNMERKLQAIPGYRYTFATTEAEATRLLDGFFTMKPLRLAGQNIHNVFADPGVEDFIRQAALKGLSSGNAAIEVHGLESDEEVIAIFAGVRNELRFSAMFTTYTMSEAAKHSPGLVLLRHLIDHCAERGCQSCDIGVGADDYKTRFCKEMQPLFDSFLPLSAGGRLVAATMANGMKTKGFLKRSPLADTLRSIRHRLAG